MSKKEIKADKNAEMKQVLIDAGVNLAGRNLSDIAYIYQNQLEGATLTLKSAGMDPAVLGFSDLQMLATARTLREVKKQESLVKKQKEARKVKKDLSYIFTETVSKKLPELSDYFSSVIGINPAKSISGKTITLQDNSKIAVSLTAIKIDPDNKKNKRLKETAEKITGDLSSLVDNFGIKKVSNLLRLEAGTKDAKAISLFPTDPNKSGCLHDDMYIYQISLRYAGAETE